LTNPAAPGLVAIQSVVNKYSCVKLPTIVFVDGNETTTVEMMTFPIIQNTTG